MSRYDRIKTLLEMLVDTPRGGELRPEQETACRGDRMLFTHRDDVCSRVAGFLADEIVTPS